MIFFQLSLKRDLVGRTRSLPSFSSIVELMTNEDKYLISLWYYGMKMVFRSEMTKGIRNQG